MANLCANIFNDTHANPLSILQFKFEMIDFILSENKNRTTGKKGENESQQECN